MRNLTGKELRETNGGIDGLAAALAEIARQMEAIKKLGTLTGTTDDIHN
ncbi:hypothetical protein IWQ47_000322 [Aquimarina sp. EL_43]|nr:MULTISPECIES: hypothetical protein [Aquimarina]MBG6128986.1 hypothetical protein [Aquimarina sp. EL_35]MBG6150050.1 hypothetical protein [Aquimarina sp. EL_32]MBG6167264.1 hypothetical protein [Aquimarina sp. EL_43]